MSIDSIPGRYAMQWIVDDALARTPPGGIWVEVGVALGKGISYMARRLIDARRHDVKLYAVDPWGGYARNGEQQAAGAATEHGDWVLFLETMRAHAPEELRRLHIIRAPSVDAAKLFRARTVSLCILDADHTFEAVSLDLEAWIPTIERGGVIGGDDHHEGEFPGVGQACRVYFGDRYEVREDTHYHWPTWRMVMP